MKLHRGIPFLILALGLCGSQGVASAQRADAARVDAARAETQRACAGSNPGGVVTVHGAQQGSPFLNFCDGRALSGDERLAGQAQPLELATADLDEDGVPDLVSGFAVGRGGEITVHRGNVHALWPYGAALRNGPPSAFFPNARVFAVPEAPDFVVTGDFDADGHWDVVTARRGGDALYFLQGDGRGGLRAAQRIPLAGNVTAMISGEINRVDGLADLIVAVNGAAGARALVFESPMGALRGQPEIFKLPKAATALALGRFDGGAMNDLAIAAGDQLVTIHARDRKLALSEAQRGGVPAAKVTAQGFPFVIQALASGDFTGTGPTVAALGEDGKIHILEHAVMLAEPGAAALKDSNFRPSMQLSKPGPDGETVTVQGRMTPGMMARLEALRQSVRLHSANPRLPEWTERSSVPLPAGFGQSLPRLVAARVSGGMQEDLLAIDGADSRLHVFSTVAGAGRVRAAELSGKPVAASMKLLASLDTEGAPAAVLPMRLNQHGLNGLVMLQSGHAGPTIMPQDATPSNTFTVTNTLDTPTIGGDVPVGSLRHAMNDAETSCSSGGLCSIVFDIPTTDPNYNPATGTFLIRPLSMSVPNADDNFALPPINATVTIDGYTQPGASPNTLASGDNARILIQIDGIRATTPGGSGLVPFDDDGSTYRGLAFTGWTRGVISAQNTESGAEGMEANGVGDFIEGNFFGTDPSGKTASPNRIGIFADNGPLFGSAPGNIIGGTTPQARNILSGNTLGGVLFLSIAFEAELQGNFVGLDATGAAALANGADGAGLNGPTVTIGGTLPGATNVISGNPTNVDINDLTDGNAAKNSTVQGNLIGTDGTGKLSVSGGRGVGVSILNNPQFMMIGGTTPAARNVISGNDYGVYIFDNSFYNSVEGNFIGTDITGAKALGNMQPGFITGATTTDMIAAGDTNIGGAVAGSGNVISGNLSDGIQIQGTSDGPNGGLETLQGNTIEGNFIGTDATGSKAIPNQGNGINLTASATNNTIGGSDPGSGNLIADNVGHGVLIDPGTANPGEGFGNITVANSILSNGKAGVRVISGTGNRISRNSIFGNKALGIDVDAAGPNTNTHCNTPNTGANDLQNSPVLTAGSGTAFISATATDPGGNTSEFSNAVQSSETGNVLNLLGTFDSAPSTAYTIEFFSSTVADPSGFGEGETYLGSTIVTTNESCTAPVSDPVNLTEADVSVTLSNDQSELEIGPDFGYDVYVGTVTNNGAATAHDVVFTDALPDGLIISGAYCDVGPCQSPVTSSLGSCLVSGNTVTCKLGTMAPGATASIDIPVQVLSPGTITNVATVKADEVDPNLANNTSSLAKSSVYPFPFIDHLDPTAALVNSPDTVLTVYGIGLLPNSAVTFNGTAVKTVALLDNQLCGDAFSQSICTGLEVLVPASLLTTSGPVTVEVNNPNPGEDGDDNFPSDATFTIAPTCSFTTDTDLTFGGNIENDGTTLIADEVSVLANVESCAWTAKSSVPWAVILDTHKNMGETEYDVADTGNATGTGSVDVAIAPNTGAATRTGTVTVAGQTFTFTQDGGASCSYILNPTAATVPVGGGAETVGVTASGSNCSYFVESFAPWITVPESSGLLVGNGTPTYNVAANLGGPRIGTVMIGGDVLTVSQGAQSCYFTLSSSGATFPVNGGTGAIGVTASAPGCAWTAKASNSSEVSITSGASGTGNGTIDYSVAVNTGGPLTPTITVGNATAYAVYTVNQVSAFACTFTISPTPLEVGTNGTSNFFVLTASNSFCKWTATSSDPASLAITGPSSGMGTSVVYYGVGQNTGGPRTLTITAGCETFTVNQDGQGATNPTPAITMLQPASAAAGSGAFMLTVNGSGFVSTSVVNFNGAARATTFVSATKLTAAILAADVAEIGTPAVTVTNPAPGGGTSNSLNFAITAASNPVPAITTQQPASATAGSGAFTLTVNGSGFVSTSVVNFNGAARATTFVSATKLTVAILASDVAEVGNPAVTVTNPAPGGGTSNPVTFAITAANNPVPAITTLQPASATTGSGAFMLTVNGSGFVGTSVVNFNGAARATTFVSATKLTAAILASDVAEVGTPAVTVTNPAPGGGTSNPVTFAITAANNPVPAITTLQPASATAGSGAFTLTVNGSGFVSTSVVNFNGAARATTFVSATKVTAAILAADVAEVGTPAVTVTNPAPGGGTSNPVTFAVTAANNPVPAITMLQPASATAGSGAFMLTVNGSGFVSTSVVNFNGAARATTFVSATKLTVAILASDVAEVGTSAVTVTNPAPGGGTSNSVIFTITTPSNPLPVITALQPGGVVAGSGALNLMVNGTGFVNGSVVDFNGAARATTFVSATQVTAALLSTDVASAGTRPITVTNPMPGGGTSNAVAFTVTNPVPAITSLQPQSVVAGAAAFTLTVNGTGFNASSVVTFNGNAKATTFVSSTQLSAAIGAADVAAAGSAPVSVTNPTPGGGTSAPVSFAITAAGVAQAQLNPTAVAFPSTVVGTSATAQSVTLSNPGSAVLTINGISIGGANPGDYSQTNTCGESLATGASCTISVVFTPASAASFAATLSVADNAAESPQTVALSGIGTAPAAPVAALTPASLTFTAVSGASSGAQAATLKNSGNAPLAITGISIAGANPGDFSQTNTCGESLAAGASCTVSVTFAPGSVASFAATLSVADNASGSPQTASLSGTGTAAPSFTVSSTTAPQTIQAGGVAQYSITVASQGGTFPGAVALSASNLPPGATAAFAPPSITPGASSASSQLSIRTASTIAAVAGNRSGLPLIASALPLFGLLFAIRKHRRRWLALCILLLASLGAVTALSGCGGGFALPSVAKTYNITITGTSGTDQQTTTVQLTVQ